MIPNLHNKQTGLHRIATFALLLGLFLSQCYLAAHSADFEAHDSELCEICLGSHSPHEPLAVGANPGIAFDNSTHCFGDQHDALAVVVNAVSNHAIRAPPITVKS